MDTKAVCSVVFSHSRTITLTQARGTAVIEVTLEHWETVKEERSRDIIRLQFRIWAQKQLTIGDLMDEAGNTPDQSLVHDAYELITLDEGILAVEAIRRALDILDDNNALDTTVDILLLNGLLAPRTAIAEAVE